MHAFSELSILLAVGALVAIIMKALRQPLIIGHILTGILVGPSVFGLINSPETIEAFSSFGIALLLFIVGLGLNPKVIKEVGKVSLLTGVGQVIFTSAIGYALVRTMGYNAMTAFYISVALTFSSTIIILKLLTDKKEHTKLYGKISIGFLLVQDIIATIALLVASATGSGGLSYDQLLGLVIKGVGLAAGVAIVSRFILRPMTAFFAKSQELLFLFAIAWGFGIGTLSHEVGFSLEVGALFAGVALAGMTYAQEAASRLRPLRDFFIIVFFITLGAKLNLANVTDVLPQAIGLSAFVLVGNPIIVMIIMGFLGYTKRTSFLAGLTVAQISEFSLIFILIGQRNGQVSEAAVSLVTIIGIITIAVSSYMIIYSSKLYSLVERYLQLFERRKVKYDQSSRRETFDIVLFGYQRGGAEFVKVFRNIGARFTVIDYDPEAIDQLERQQIPYLYGDASDPELLDEASISKAKMVVTTITDHETNTFLVKLLEATNPSCVVICHSDSVEQAAELYELGASYVMMPHYIGSEKIGAFIKKNRFNKSEFRRYRQKHLEYLESHYSVSDELDSE